MKKEVIGQQQNNCKTISNLGCISVQLRFCNPTGVVTHTYTRLYCFDTLSVTYSSRVSARTAQ